MGCKESLEAVAAGDLLVLWGCVHPPPLRSHIYASNPVWILGAKLLKLKKKISSFRSLIDYFIFKYPI